MSLVTLGGVPAGAARMQVPAWGRWWGDLSLTEPTLLAGAQTLVFADVPAVCTVISGGVFNGRAAYRVVGGAGGWGKNLPAKPYQNDLGVKLANILGDAARSVGETLQGATGATGPQFARAEGPASAVLHLLAPRNWYVDFAGATQIGQRPVTTYTGKAPRTRVDPAVNVIEIATDTIAGILPGLQVDGSLPATDVEFELTEKRLVARVYAGRGRSRRLDAIARILEALDPLRRYRGTYEFRVVTQDGERLNLQPVRAASGLPDLPRVPVRPGTAGLRATVQLGELVLVAFADADPSRPQVIAHDAADAPGFMPAEIDIGESPRLGVARITDTVQAGPFAGAITGASARVKACL